MSERPTETPAWRATEPSGPRIDERKRVASARYETGMAPSGETVAVRAERFRNGAPFLVERATLYDPFPLEPLPVSAGNRLPRPRSVLPAALTLLGVVVVVGLAAAVLFVRNADAPRLDPGDRTARTSAPIAPRQEPDPTSPRDGITYDLTRRANDAITGAWRLPKEIEAHPVSNDRQAGPPPAPLQEAPVVTSAPPTPDEPRRALPRRITVTRFAQPPRPDAEPQMPARAPLDEPHVPKVALDDEPISRPPIAPEAAKSLKLATPQSADRTGPNVVARVRRADDTPEERVTSRARKVALPLPPSDEDAREAAKSGAMSRRARRAQLRRMREARREAQDLDRFQLRYRGDIPKGFVYSGPQGQRP